MLDLADGDDQVGLGQVTLGKLHGATEAHVDWHAASFEGQTHQRRDRTDVGSARVAEIGPTRGGMPGQAMLLYDRVEEDSLLKNPALATGCPSGGWALIAKARLSAT
jgi:hypothetical protein